MKQRVITALILIPPILLAVFLSNPFAVFCLALVALGIGYSELAKLARSTWPVPILGSLVAADCFLILALSEIVEGLRGRPLFSDLGRMAFPPAFVVLNGFGALGVWLLVRGKKGFFVTELASLWLIAGLAGLVELKFLDGTGKGSWSFDSSLLLALIPLWIGDTLAIFAGRAFGKHPLAPRISPKKTVEGGIANLLGCIAAAIGLALLIGQPVIVGLLVGLATGILGQAGDLLESAMKRSVGVKDSGTLLPGHGGLLDRIDSILLSAPAVALIVIFLGK